MDYIISHPEFNSLRYFSDRTTVSGLKELLSEDMLNYCHERHLLQSMVQGGNDDVFQPKTKRSKSC